MKNLTLPFRFLAIATVAATFLVSGCQSNPEGTDAEVGAAQEVGDVSASAVSYELDTTSSELTWYGFKPTGRHNGSIAIDDGQLMVEGDQIAGGSFTMDMSQIEVEDLEGEDKQKLTGHLKSPDFFAVEEYPTAQFEIVEVTAYNEGAVEEDTSRMDVVVNDEEVSEYAIENPTHTITGNLSMRDTTLSVTFPADVSVADNQVSAEAKFNIDRTKWNVSYGDENDPVAQAKDQFIYNTVNVGFNIVATKAEEATASVN